MYVQQFYLGCLAQASYMIGSDGEAVVVDPRRDVDVYLEEAKARGLSIRYVVETHLHADFVSGHRELAARTGAEIVFGAKAQAAFPHRAVRDGDEIRVGRVSLAILETPGHTPESISVVVSDGEAPGAPAAVLTGDTLFIGDVGRPDLAGGRGFTPQQMAAMLYDSLHEKVLALPDDVEVWPAHGAGSACGRNISKETSSTIGVQRKTNYALAAMPREEFVKLLTSDMPAAPAYFPRDAEINRRGARSLDDVDAPRIAPDQIGDAVILDVRDAEAFGASHIPNAINIGLGGQFASWCGTLLSFERPIVIVAGDEDRCREAVMRLARVGLENVAGTLLMSDWNGEVESLPQISPQQLAEAPVSIVDVRRRGEFESGHIPGARNIPLDELPRRFSEIDRDARHAVVCAGGYRSSMAASILAGHGFSHLSNVVGGTAAWVKSGLPTD
jgi:glyoxylase-like metal-dependent hydrolase (beta-lactamase superfamily II)/rhodanese-related sulfurtransferase